MPTPATELSTIEVIQEEVKAPKPSFPVKHDENNKARKQVTLKRPMQQCLSKVHRILNNQHPEAFQQKNEVAGGADKKNFHFDDVKSRRTVMLVWRRRKVKLPKRRHHQS